MRQHFITPALQLYCVETERSAWNLSIPRYAFYSDCNNQSFRAAYIIMETNKKEPDEPLDPLWLISPNVFGMYNNNKRS
jgi:hypothetical protein